MPEEKTDESNSELCVKLRDVCFRFEKNGENIIKNLSLDIFKNEVLCILGGNAAGKTTLLKLICGILKPQSGSITFSDFDGENVKDKIGYLPQNPAALFSKSTVYDDIASVCGENRNIGEIISLCRLEALSDRHPYDLSGGERQRAALAKLLARGFDILVLDEPSKGLDNDYKALLSAIIGYLKRQRKTIVIVSHDADFCAENADRCAMLFGGEITVSCTPKEFFTENFFFTTDAAKIAKGTADGIFTTPQLIYSCCKSEPPKIKINIDADCTKTETTQKTKDREKKKPSAIRKICAVTGAALALALMLINSGLFPAVLPSEPFFLPYIFLLAPIILLIAGVAPKNRLKGSPTAKKMKPADEIAAVATVIIIPLTAVCGSLFFDGRKYLFISLLILAECLIPFILLFEHKKPSAKDVAVLALMCAAAIAGRELFFMFPQFKPTAAIVIVAAAAFGAQSGFLVGAVSMLVSNMMFGQGTWTPWQMLAMGLVGFFAGLIFSRRRSAVALCIYGFISVTVIYGGIMNISSVLIYQSNVTVGHVLSYIASGLPFDLIHGAATVVFLLLGGTQILEKCERAKMKFGLFQ